VDAANALTELFLRYYYHGEPFRPEALRATWRSCAEPECMRARQTAERRLEGLHDAG
jgi:hypothetical protein